MSVELMQTLSVVAFALAGVMLVVAVVLFFVLNIPRVFGEVSGSTAKKAIEDIRKQNETTGNKAYKPSPVNQQRGKITEKISSHGSSKSKNKDVTVSVGTAQLKEMNAADTSSETVMLENETAVLASEAGETSVLENTSGQNDFGITGPLFSDRDTFEQIPSSGNVTVEYEICFVGSNEIIG